ncbi:hypothetical protein CK203_015354 [Vitis vinifera]|uniref:Endonuclease/exonuclease/phosphatase domain-containing protein n=1 Tax=Vitis vinifera TaxID=29760 RepID=A0A438JK41_VITVI|nr:hypothetical protein CK203_015354 [Vitis vinifera]
MRDRRDRSENLSGKKRKGQRTSRFDRELKKLEWSVNYSGSGGDRGVLQLEEMEVGNYSVSCRFKNVEDGFCWAFSGVYGPSVKVEKEEFLSELGAIKGLWNEPWCVTGDFNMIRCPFERSRGGRLSHQCGDSQK